MIIYMFMYIYIGLFICIYVTANLRYQIFPGIPNPFRESGESLKCIEISQNAILKRFPCVYGGEIGALMVVFICFRAHWSTVPEWQNIVREIDVSRPPN